MIEEINNFIKSINDNYSEIYKTCNKPENGIYILVQPDNNSEKSFEYNIALAFKKENIDPANILDKCAELDFYSECINSNKSIDEEKKINSCSPYSIIFSSYYITKKTKKRFSEVENRFDNYFKNVKDFCSKESLEYSEDLNLYCKNELLNILKEKNIFEEEFFKEEWEYKDKIKLTKGYTIRIYLDIDLKFYQESYKKYLENYIFVKDKYNFKNTQNIVYGIPSFFTTYNDKKPFLVHTNASFEYNKKVTHEEAINLLYFLKLAEKKSLPNPLPIFIYEEELNLKFVKLFNENKALTYSEIIREIFKTRRIDLHNYYLLNYYNGGINDYDFVSHFRYNLEQPIRIINLFFNKDDILINNIFSFEKEIFNKIFNLSSDEQINYFSDLKLKDSILQINLLKYRKAIYNYIYKSKIQSITQEMFNDLVCSMILDDIKNDKYNNNKHTKINSIIEKLNIWFNLYEYFQNNKNNKYMKTKIKELQEKNKLISETDNSIETDEEFAFVSGQVIFYLLSLSESSNKTHALLEPFLQKIDIDLFKQSIINLFNKYKHNIYFKQSKFEKLISEILCYVPEKNIKELMPYILAGYFSENEIFKKKDNNISTKNEDEINN